MAGLSSLSRTLHLQWQVRRNYVFAAGAAYFYLNADHLIIKKSLGKIHRTTGILHNRNVFSPTRITPSNNQF